MVTPWVFQVKPAVMVRSMSTHCSHTDSRTGRCFLLTCAANGPTPSPNIHQHTHTTPINDVQLRYTGLSKSTHHSYLLASHAQHFRRCTKHFRYNILSTFHIDTHFTPHTPHAMSDVVFGDFKRTTSLFVTHPSIRRVRHEYCDFPSREESGRRSEVHS